MSGLEVGELKTQARDRTYDISPETLFLLQTGRSPARPFRVAPVIKTVFADKVCVKGQRIGLRRAMIRVAVCEQGDTQLGVKSRKNLLGVTGFALTGPARLFHQRSYVHMRHHSLDR